MTVDLDGLRQPLAEGDLRLEPVTETHREPLRTACAADRDIWPIYYLSFTGADFDHNFERTIADPDRVPFAVTLDEALVGMSSFTSISTDHRTLEIGTTYYHPMCAAPGSTGGSRR